MKITKSQLKQIIKEELKSALDELRMSDVERSLENTEDPDEFEQMSLSQAKKMRSPEEKKALKNPKNKDNPYYRQSAQDVTLRKKKKSQANLNEDSASWDLEPEEGIDAADHAIEIIDALKDMIADMFDEEQE